MSSWILRRCLAGTIYQHFPKGTFAPSWPQNLTIALRYDHRPDDGGIKHLRNVGKPLQ